MPGKKKSKASPAVDAPDRRRLPMLLRRAWYGLNQAFRRRIAHLNLTPDQFTVLRTLLEQDGISQRELTALMSSDPNTVAALLERMEKAGLIGRETHEKDRRANRLGLKPKGRARYKEARKIAIQLQVQILDTLPMSRREEFLSDLDTVAAACRTAAADSPKSGRQPRGVF
ncbi:MAG TPA: MarR family winged helix-turn-helix transcriptional regulator [Verrucomicrobiota bacterium]|nr:MarR family winged helix-turn-helix transcriptional regulator [Verrucomicrobiota bacterium]